MPSDDLPGMDYAFGLTPLGDEGRERMGRCLELAKRRVIDLLWRSASIEVAGITFPRTRDVFRGVDPGDARARDVAVVNNLKRAWERLFAAAGDVPCWGDLSDYNALVTAGVDAGGGLLRTEPVSITGTEWTPGMPGDVDAELFDDLSAPDPEDRALSVFLSVCRGQWFADGNKRTAVMAANHCLIHDGVGVFALPPERMRDDFIPRLLAFYESGDRGPFAAWLSRHAIGRLDDGGLTRAQMDGEDPAAPGARADDA